MYLQCDSTIAKSCIVIEKQLINVHKAEPQPCPTLSMTGVMHRHVSDHPLLRLLSPNLLRLFYIMLESIILCSTLLIRRQALVFITCIYLIGINVLSVKFERQPLWCIPLSLLSQQKTPIMMRITGML